MTGEATDRHAPKYPGESPYKNGRVVVWRRRRIATLLIVSVGLSLILSSCKVDSTVSIDVEADGGGTVSVAVKADAEAAKMIGDPSASLRLGDLTEAGWRVEPPRVDDKSGSLNLQAKRSFRSADELTQILSDFGGGVDAPFFDGLKLKVTDGFGRTDYSFAVNLQMKGGLASLSDPALTEVLGGLPVGRTPEELTAAGWDGSGMGTLKVRLRLPGGPEAHNGTRVGDTVEWSVPLAADATVDKSLQASSTSVQRQVQWSRYLGISAVVAAIVVALAGMIRRR